MPIYSPAFKMTCQVCGWSKTFPPLGDARLPGQVFEKCPKCSSENLAHVKANLIEKIFLKIKTFTK